MKNSGIAIAVVGAGVVVGLSACGPNSLAAHKTTPTGSPSASMSAGASGGGMNSAAPTGSNASGAYQYTTLDDPGDPTFNQLLGMNNHGMIAGYFGSGAAGHPNKGYMLVRGNAGFVPHNENFPGSVQTQVIGINDSGTTVGFWSSMNTANQTNDNTGFVDIHGFFHSVKFPTANNANPPVNQLLGVNNEDVAVGFYNDAKGNAHGYTYSIVGGRFKPVMVSGATSVTPAGINNFGDITGFMTNAAGTTEGFLQTRSGHVTPLAFPGASATQATGVNDEREVVGNYTVGTGSSAVTHGFTWSAKVGFQTVDDPKGVGSTIINGVNDHGKIVGFYTDTAGNTDGFVAVPMGQTPQPGLAGSMASPTASPSSSMMPTSPSSSMMPSATMSPSAMPTSSMGTKPSTMPTAPTTAPSGGTMPSVTPSNLQPTHF